MNPAYAIVGVLFALIAQTAPDTAQVTLQDTDISLTGRLTFSARGLAPGEPTTITVEDDQGGVQATLQPVPVEPDGQVYMVSLPIPPGLAPGAHTLRVAGLTSRLFGRASFSLRWQTPAVHLETYTGKPNQTISFGGSGFVPGESVDMFLGDPTGTPLVTVTANGQGDISGHYIGIPSLAAGDYSAVFIGRASQTQASVGFNIQGFHPWVVLHNYYLEPRSGVGFTGHDFAPGEVVQIYVNSRLSGPLTQMTADGDGALASENVPLPNLSGDNTLIFVGEQSQTELTTSFSVAKE